ncbi:hypothetical protein SSTU70S_04952 [Stutzerimonas stutzeri]
MDYRNECAKNLLAKLAQHGIEARAGYFWRSHLLRGRGHSQRQRSRESRREDWRGTRHHWLGSLGDGFIIAFRNALVSA